MSTTDTALQLPITSYETEGIERVVRAGNGVLNGEIEVREAICRLNAECEQKYKSKFLMDASLNRSLVSFQANKKRPVYRWYKYKEAFSAGMVEYFLEKFKLQRGTLFDPFAGIGTALFVANGLGIDAEGIELLPIGQQIIETKLLIDNELKEKDIAVLVRWAKTQPWTKAKGTRTFNELRITKGAYPAETLKKIEKYLAAADEESKQVSALLIFGLLCVLESVSYTRKDGQYLRWDHRSGRRRGKKIFNKGKILSFDDAISNKLDEILLDLKANKTQGELFEKARAAAKITLHSGSCLEIMPEIPKASYNCIVTSPPYCNRYDYTRTYALELALLGVDEAGLVKLRQEMLSCTVENRAKNLLEMNPGWNTAIAATNNQDLLQAILHYLDQELKLKHLNNNGIPRMVRGYFYEMACIIAESARVLKRGAPLIMVNDNVRYAGVSISVDIILSDIAEKLGFETESILVLPTGKGNSSQQMGLHGREMLRKCVYVWRKK